MVYHSGSRCYTSSFICATLTLPLSFVWNLQSRWPSTSPTPLPKVYALWVYGNEVSVYRRPFLSLPSKWKIVQIRMLKRKTISNVWKMWRERNALKYCYRFWFMYFVSISFLSGFVWCVLHINKLCEYMNYWSLWAAVNGDANRLDIYIRQSVNAFTSIRSRAFMMFATKYQSITELSYQVGLPKTPNSAHSCASLVMSFASLHTHSQNSHYPIDQLKEYCSCSFILFLHFRSIEVI